jgi:hypothetical protein
MHFQCNIYLLVGRIEARRHAERDAGIEWCGATGAVPAWRGAPALEKGHDGWGLVPSAGEREVSVASGARNEREQAA